MPNKTIYVSDEDEPLFRRAQALAGGNLSAAIARAVRRFVETEEHRMAGFEEFTVRVGSPGGRRDKRFRGRPVAHWSHEDSQGCTEAYTVYRTQGGRYAVHREQGRPWQAWPGIDPWRWVQQFTGMGWPGAHGHHGHHSPWHGWGHGHRGWAPQQWTGRGQESTLQVFDTLEELRKAVPTQVVQQVEENEADPPVDDLDI